MSSAATPIQVESLSKTYRDGLLRRREIPALREVSFQVAPGEIFGLLGPNGAGKTTFIKILLGVVRKTGGAAKLLGFTAGDLRGRRRIGYLPERLRIEPYHNAHTALDYFGKLSGLSGAEIRQRRGPLLEMVGLAGRVKDPVRKYSKGMLQRLGVAKALIHHPELLILDEPTDGLDPVGRSHMRGILRDLKQQGKTVFLNSHLLQEVELICDRVAILDHGRLRYVGPVADVSAVSGADFELDLQLMGDEQTIVAALGPHRADRMELAGALRHVSVRLSNQSEVDRLVDSLRAAGVSITGLSRRRLSLEDAFLQILREGGQPVELT